jgi:hypothetical protein
VLKAKDVESIEQKQLLDFMAANSISCKLAAKLFKTYENKIHFYRSGRAYLDPVLLKDFKERYLQYIEHKQKRLKHED